MRADEPSALGRKQAAVLRINDYYSGILRTRRINAPTIQEAAKDLERQFPIYVG